jgi:hypothetical protein
MIGNRKRTIALSAASAIVSSTPPAIAAQFDGEWSMVAETTRGHCGTIAVGLEIDRGEFILPVDLSLFTQSGWAAAFPPRGRSGSMQWLARARPMGPDGSDSFGAAALGPVAGPLVSARAFGVPTAPEAHLRPARPHATD